MREAACVSTGDTQGKISQERLSQIAERKLKLLQLSHRADSQGRLEGELPLTPGRVTHPATGAAITQVTFQVVGHDRLRFTQGPFSGLEPVPYYDVDSLASLETRVLQLLQLRVVRLRDLDARLKPLGLVSKLDVDALRLRSAVKGPEVDYELSAGPEGLRVTRLLPHAGNPVLVPEHVPPIVLEEINSPTDLTFHLESRSDLKALITQPAAPAPAAPRAGTAPTGLKALPPPPGALLLAAVARLADAGVHLVGGELVEELEAGGKRYRFTAQHESGSVFNGKLVGPTGERWNEKFDLARFPGILPFVRSFLGVSAETPPAPSPPTAPAQAAVPSEPLPPHLTPQPGENWVMNVLVERDDGQEVRYVCTDVDGHPYGAARILKKSDFTGVFSPSGAGWRLRIHILKVEPDGVSYQQVNPQGEVSPNVKKIPPSTFASSFLPEAADY
jgi:hypothetical protein